MLIVRDLSTVYQATGDADTVVRIVTVAMDAKVSADGESCLISPAPYQRRDTCLRREAMLEQSSQLNATHGELPAEERTMWEDLLEPAIFVAAAATTVVLLFTVRSQ
jgi:hypothetical protein